MSEPTPTRSVILELQDDRNAMQEGYSFLDEKRMLLAGEMLRLLRRYESLFAAFRERFEQASRALRAAVVRHGLEGIQCYPAAGLERASVRASTHKLLGVPLQDAQLEGDATSAAPSPNPSPEAEACRALFADVVRQAAVLAGLAGNLERLRQEYRKTERRARALEDVLLPEIEQTLYTLELRLAEIEQNEAIRVRQKHA